MSIEIDHDNDRPFKKPPARRKAVIVTWATIGGAAALGMVAVVVFLALLVRLFELIA